LLLAALLAALAASSALARRPPNDDANADVTPAAAGVAKPAVAAGAALKSGAAAADACSSGAHTLSHFGDRVYPEMGNGGYTSVHTDVHLNYDAPTNMLLPGTHVDLKVRSTQCLTDLSFDFERTSSDATDGSEQVGRLGRDQRSAG
jgi:hypothetical protein